MVFQFQINLKGFWEIAMKLAAAAVLYSFSIQLKSYFSLAFSGYLIPKGWKVLPLFRNIHHSPENFTDPEKFDPSRFEVLFIELAKRRKKKNRGTQRWNIGIAVIGWAYSIILVIELF